MKALLFATLPFAATVEELPLVELGPAELTGTSTEELLNTVKLSLPPAVELSLSPDVDDPNVQFTDRQLEIIRAAIRDRVSRDSSDNPAMKNLKNIPPPTYRLAAPPSGELQTVTVKQEVESLFL